MNNLTLWKVFSAIVLAILAGILIPADFSIWGVPVIQYYGLTGQLFLNALTLVVVPLVCSSIIIGASKMGSEESAGRLGFRTFSYFIFTTFLAILVGYVLTVWIQPGASMSPPDTGNPIVQTHDSGFQKIEQILFRLIPTNIIAAASQGQMLGLIVFSLVFGYFLGKIDKQPAGILIGFWQGIYQTMMKITRFVMHFLPVGVFALVAKVIAGTGWSSLISVAMFLGINLMGMAIFSLIILPLVLKIMARANIKKHFSDMGPALLTAFSTSSSAATLPVTLDCMEKRAGISNRICSFVLPLGTSINMPGTALYACTAVFFIAQAYGIPLSLSSQFLVILMVLLTSFGIAGIPSASLFAVVTVLNMIGIPAEGIGLILAVERILDMSRTAVNVWANSCCTLILDSAEKSAYIPFEHPATDMAS